MCRSPVPVRSRSRQRSRIYDRVLDDSKRFNVIDSHSDIDRLHSTNTTGAFGEVGREINQDLKLAKHPDQKLREVAFDHSGQIGP